jgi:hypothetical protein
MRNRNAFMLFFTFFVFCNIKLTFAVDKDQLDVNNTFLFYSKPASTVASAAAIVGSIGFFFKQKAPRSRYLALFVSGCCLQQSLNIAGNYYHMKNFNNKHFRKS